MPEQNGVRRQKRERRSRGPELGALLKPGHIPSELKTLQSQKGFIALIEISNETTFGNLKYGELFSFVLSQELQKRLGKESPTFQKIKPKIIEKNGRYTEVNYEGVTVSGCAFLVAEVPVYRIISR